MLCAVYSPHLEHAFDDGFKWTAVTHLDYKVLCREADFEGRQVLHQRVLAWHQLCNTQRARHLAICALFPRLRLSSPEAATADQEGACGHTLTQQPQQRALEPYLRSHP